MTEVAVRVDHVSKTFRLYHERNQSLKSAVMRGRTSVHDTFLALEDVTFDVPTGSTFGLIGSNGSGKSTLLKCLANIYYPNSGTITHFGKIAAMLEVGSGFHAELSGRENIFLNGSILGMTKKEVTRKLDEIIDFSGVEQFIDQPVKNYSSGMYVRLGFAIAINVDPDILVVDEVLAVGDGEFQEKCFQKFRDFKAAGKTVILVSHSMETVEAMCDQAAWLNKGKLETVGSAAPTIKAYLDTLPTGP
ncbi:ABC transporter ATP-binding protein [Lacisediminihabitans sp. H27-G8]|uniref:ABC transporter ATP-binding protein n=1 Tax=Lacisediminihabitans sp. H27-G8 TaxID=3111909 RepID=UPI0038FC2A42